MHQVLTKFIFIVLSLFIGAPLAYAQTTPAPVQYTVSPEVPGPGQLVLIEAQGIGSFLGNAAITWSVGGKVVQSGAGLRTYSFTTGPVGSITTVHVDIKSTTDGSFSHDFVFRPSAVNLIWEANTSAPPLYLGKPLYSAGSPLKISAFPTLIVNSSRVAASSLSYQWSVNETPLPAQSGLGRSTLSINGDQLQSSENVGVDVYFGSSLVGRGAISIPASTPQVVLYERDALRGVLYDLALPQGIALTAKEITITAEPYYFSNPSLRAGALQYSWTLNGDEITGPDSGHGILTLRQTGSGSGSATLATTLQNNNQDQLVQSAQAMVSILFGQQGSASASFFGL